MDTRKPAEDESLPENISELPMSDESDAPEDQSPLHLQPVAPKQASRRRWLPIFILILVLLAIGVWLWLRNDATPLGDALRSASNQQLELVAHHDYGNRYQDGILPVGDGKYTGQGPKQGYVYACSDYAHSLAGQPTGTTKAPWLSHDGKTYNQSKKPQVQGSVIWQPDTTNLVIDGTRNLVTSSLPSHPTGTFPVGSPDPSYRYAHNANAITSQTATYRLPYRPTYQTKPNCVHQQVGIMLTGAALYAALNPGGRDAGAWELTDHCGGQPDSQGIYHYHILSPCISDTSVQSVIGFAMDGYPITGPKIASDNVLTSRDLDVCHGITSQITLDGRSVRTYHYVMTSDFPYSVSCFRGKPVDGPDR